MSNRFKHRQVKLAPSIIPTAGLKIVCVVFGWEASGLKCLLMEDSAKSQSLSRLPGAFVLPGTNLDRSAKDVLAKRTGLKNIFLEQLYTFGSLKSHRSPYLAVSYYALVSLSQDSTLREGKGYWAPVAELSGLAEDEHAILAKALDRLKGKVRYQPIGFELLPSKFTLSQLQNLYETVLERPLDKRNFRKKILSMDLIQPLGEFQSEVAHRAARLYRFDERRYANLRKQGFNFEI